MTSIVEHRHRGFYPFLCWVLLLSLTAGIVFIGLLSTKMRLSGDDYCLDAILHQEGLWGMVIRSYIEISTYNGNRYSQIFFSGLAGLSPLHGNGGLVVSSLIVWVIGLTCLVRWVVRRLHLVLSTVEIFILAEAYACLVLWSTIKLDQSVLWRSAMTAYFMPMVAFTWLLMFIIWVGESKRLIGLKSAMIFLFAILGAGFSETGAAFQGGILSLVMLVILIFGKKNPAIRMYFLPVLMAILGLLTGIALMYYSPVTGMRRSSLPETIHLRALGQLLFQNIKIYLWHTFVRRTPVILVPFIFGMGLCLNFFIFRPLKNHHPWGRFTWQHWVLGIVFVSISAIFLILCVMLPATYIQGSYPPERALILAQSVLTLASLVGGTLLVLLSNSIVNISGANHAGVRTTLQVVSFVLIFSVIVSPMLLIYENIEKVQFYNRWSQLWELRHEELLEAGRKNQDEVHILQLDHIVSDVGELSPDPDYWYNNCAEMYYEIESIYADLPGW